MPSIIGPYYLLDIVITPYRPNTNDAGVKIAIENEELPLG